MLLAPRLCVLSHDDDAIQGEEDRTQRTPTLDVANPGSSPYHNRYASALNSWGQ